MNNIKFCSRNWLRIQTFGRENRVCVSERFVSYTEGYATTNDPTTKSFYQKNQDATTNTDATTNAEEYYRPT